MSLHASDKTSAFLGFAIGALIILASLYAVVQWTNARFAGHGATAGEVAH